MVLLFRTTRIIPRNLSPRFLSIIPSLWFTILSKLNLQLLSKRRSPSLRCTILSKLNLRLLSKYRSPRLRFPSLSNLNLRLLSVNNIIRFLPKHCSIILPSNLDSINLSSLWAALPSHSSTYQQFIMGFQAKDPMLSNTSWSHLGNRGKRTCRYWRNTIIPSWKRYL